MSEAYNVPKFMCRSGVKLLPICKPKFEKAHLYTPKAKYAEKIKSVKFRTI